MLGGSNPLPEDLLEWCHNYWTLFASEKHAETAALKTRKQPRWEAPSRGSLKINTDAGRGRSNGSWATAAVARDSSRGFVEVHTAVVKRPIHPLAAELMAIREGLLLGFRLIEMDREETSFWLESDCLQAVQELKRTETACGDREGLILHIKQLMQNSSCRGVLFTYREANRLAHCVAKFTHRMGDSDSRSGSLSIEACSVLEAEKPSPC